MITSMNNETIKDILKLKQKKYRDETGLFLIEGYHLIEEARKQHCIKTVITSLNDTFDEDTIYVSENIMKKLAFTKSPQPIMAICYKRNNNIDLNSHRYILLDQIQDPGNLGTIIRSALAFGYDQVILSKDCVDIYNDKVIRSTQGAMFHINIVTMDLREAIELLHKNHIEVYGTSLENGQDIHMFEKKEKMAFVMGNEGNGVSQEILDICDKHMYIPIQGIDSLNVAIATGIIMYEFN
ncbi:MAG: RNA methyltransferase [Erysipelotrichaceae bacterium]|nr:RNA methyltransferase [Erysipelotrichaceae bacterium]